MRDFYGTSSIFQPSARLLPLLALAACTEQTADVATEPVEPPNPVLDQPIVGDADADVVLVFPALTLAELDEQWQALRPWMEERASRGLTFGAVPLYDVTGGDPELQTS